MPRRARLDAPGTLHHVIVRGIEKPGLIWFIFSLTYSPLALKTEDTFSRVDEDLTSAVISFRTLVRVAGFALMREDFEHKTLKLENVP